MVGDGSFLQSGSSFDERLHGVDVAAYLVHAGTEDGALDLYHVQITVQGGVDADGVFVHQFELAHVKLADAEYGIAVAGLAVYADGLGVGVAREATGIAEQGGSTLRLLHLVEHGALHLTGDVDQCLVGTDGDDVVVLQAHVACQLTIEQEVVDVDVGEQTATAVHLDVTQRSDVVRTAGHVEGIVYGGESRHGIGAGHLHLAHHAHRDGACLPQGQLNLRTLIAWADDTLQAGFGLTDRQTAQLDDANVLDGDGAVGRDNLRETLL